jgi:hypothetical protein
LRLILIQDRPQKITFAELRSSGVRGLLIYCADYRCSHYIAVSGDQWPEDVRLSDLEPKYSACGKQVADVRPDFAWESSRRQGLLITTNRKHSNDYGHRS